MNKLKFLSLLIVIVSIFSACKKEDVPKGEVKTYPLKGVVLSVDKDKKKVKVKHEPIKDYMDAMTMDFVIKNEDWVFEELQPSAEIRADLVVDSEMNYWLEKVGIVATPNPNLPPPPINENFAQIGKETPDFSLTNQDGKKISFKDFRGKAFAITFIYARCPLPEYCIKMSSNFSDATKIINNSPELKDKVRLLSISFDPATDTPEKLKQYGLGYLRGVEKPDFTIWQLAVGKDKEVREVADFFGLRYEVDQNDKTQFNHSLRTAIIDPNGKVTKVVSGSDWSVQELLDGLKTALEEKK
jgi:protein SCO1